MIPTRFRWHVNLNRFVIILLIISALGLALRLAADQAHSFRRLNFQCDPVQQGPLPIGERDFVETNEWHGFG